MKVLNVILVLGLVVGVYCNCGCLKCNKNLQVISPPGAKVKVIYRDVPCACPSSLPYSLEVPLIPVSGPTGGRTYGYQVQPGKLPEANLCPSLRDYDIKIQAPLSVQQQVPPLLGLLASTDRVVLGAPSPVLPPYCPRPTIEALGVPTLEKLAILNAIRRGEISSRVGASKLAALAGAAKHVKLASLDGDVIRLDGLAADELAGDTIYLPAQKKICTCLRYDLKVLIPYVRSSSAQTYLISETPKRYFYTPPRVISCDCGKRFYVNPSGRFSEVQNLHPHHFEDMEQFIIAQKLPTVYDRLWDTNFFRKKSAERETEHDFSTVSFLNPFQNHFAKALMIQEAKPNLSDQQKSLREIRTDFNLPEINHNGFPIFSSGDRLQFIPQAKPTKVEPIGDGKLKASKVADNNGFVANVQKELEKFNRSPKLYQSATTQLLNHPEIVQPVLVGTSNRNMDIKFDQKQERSEEHFSGLPAKNRPLLQSLINFNHNQESDNFNNKNFKNIKSQERTRNLLNISHYKFKGDFNVGNDKMRFQQTLVQISNAASIQNPKKRRNNTNNVSSFLSQNSTTKLNLDNVPQNFQRDLKSVQNSPKVSKNLNLKSIEGEKQEIYINNDSLADSDANNLVAQTYINKFQMKNQALPSDKFKKNRYNDFDLNTNLLANTAGNLNILHSDTRYVTMNQRLYPQTFLRDILQHVSINSKHLSNAESSDALVKSRPRRYINYDLLDQKSEPTPSSKTSRFGKVFQHLHRQKQGTPKQLTFGKECYHTQDQSMPNSRQPNIGKECYYYLQDETESSPRQKVFAKIQKFSSTPTTQNTKGMHMPNQSPLLKMKRHSYVGNSLNPIVSKTKTIKPLKPKPLQVNKHTAVLKSTLKKASNFVKDLLLTSLDILDGMTPNYPKQPYQRHANFQPQLKPIRPFRNKRGVRITDESILTFYEPSNIDENAYEELQNGPQKVLRRGRKSPRSTSKLQDFLSNPSNSLNFQPSLQHRSPSYQPMLSQLPSYQPRLQPKPSSYQPMANFQPSTKARDIYQNSNINDDEDDMPAMPIMSVLTAPMRVLTNFQNIGTDSGPIVGAIPKMVKFSRRYLIEFLKNAFRLGTKAVTGVVLPKRLLPKKRLRRSLSVDSSEYERLIQLLSTFLGPELSKNIEKLAEITGRSKRSISSDKQSYKGLSGVNGSLKDIKEIFEAIRQELIGESVNKKSKHSSGNKSTPESQFTNQEKSQDHELQLDNDMENRFEEKHDDAMIPLVPVNDDNHSNNLQNINFNKGSYNIDLSGKNSFRAPRHVDPEILEAENRIPEKTLAKNFTNHSNSENVTLNEGKIHFEIGTSMEETTTQYKELAAAQKEQSAPLEDSNADLHAKIWLEDLPEIEQAENLKLETDLKDNPNQFEASIELDTLIEDYLKTNDELEQLLNVTDDALSDESGADDDIHQKLLVENGNLTEEPPLLNGDDEMEEEFLKLLDEAKIMANPTNNTNGVKIDDTKEKSFTEDTFRQNNDSIIKLEEVTVKEGIIFKVNQTPFNPIDEKNNNDKTTMLTPEPTTEVEKNIKDKGEHLDEVEEDRTNFDKHTERTASFNLEQELSEMYKSEIDSAKENIDKNAPGQNQDISPSINAEESKIVEIIDTDDAVTNVPQKENVKGLGFRKDPDLDIQIQTIQDKIGQLSANIQAVGNANFQEDFDMYNSLLKLQVLKLDITKAWRNLLLLKRPGHPVFDRMHLLEKLTDAEQLKRITLHSISTKLEQDVFINSLVRVLIRLQKFHCVIKNFRQRLTNGQFDTNKELSDIEFLERLYFVSGQNMEEILSNLEMQRRTKIFDDHNLLESLQKVLLSEDDNIIREEAKVLWEINNLKKLQQETIAELNKKILDNQRIRRELKILFDLQKQFEHCEDKQSVITKKVKNVSGVSKF